ncbi:MAG: response regulator [Hyphomicrobium sp.]|nr:MAG: response regulator [Hyphomicrobium sp.]PPD01924.1 MAG: response regulator [Hyphomicrobium sp.]
MQHCFIIDDSEIIRKYARLIFEGLGYRVSESESPEAALPRLATETPDIMLIDWRVPGHDMQVFITNLRTLFFDKRPYIIYVTSEGDYGDVHRALKSGADDFLLKPFNRGIIEMKLQDIRLAA